MLRQPLKLVADLRPVLDDRRGAVHAAEPAVLGLVGARRRRRAADGRRDDLRGRLPARGADHAPDHRARAGGRHPAGRLRARAWPGGWRWRGRSAPACRCWASWCWPRPGIATPTRTRCGWRRRSRSWPRSASAWACSRSRSRRARSPSRSPRCGGRWRASRRASSTSRSRSTTAARSACSRPASTRWPPACAERERVRDLFGRHVGREVAQAALERDGDVELGGEVREVAVVFVDVIGSTRLAARRPPHEVVAAAERASSRSSSRWSRSTCGWVNKFEGDAALCVFGAPTARPDAAGDALRAARRLDERLRPRARGRGGRHRRVGGAGGGRQRRRRGALRVHGDRRPGQRGRAALRAGQAARRAPARVARRCCAAPTPRRPRTGRSSSRSCCAAATRPRGVAVPVRRLSAVS